MWISSNQNKRRAPETESAQLGEVTLSGETVGIFLSQERRGAKLIAPGGYHWRPREGNTVLVMKAGEAQEPCLLGEEEGTQRQLQPGEIWISVTDESGIHLRRDGRIELFGAIYANGKLLSSPPPKEG